MAFKMKYSGSGFPFFGRDKKGETWAEGTSEKQKRIERRLAKSNISERKRQRNLARLEAMKKGEMRQKYVHQPIESEMPVITDDYAEQNPDHK